MCRFGGAPGDVRSRFSTTVPKAASVCLSAAARPVPASMDVTSMPRPVLLSVATVVPYVCVQGCLSENLQILIQSANLAQHLKQVLFPLIERLEEFRSAGVRLAPIHQSLTAKLC